MKLINQSCNCKELSFSFACIHCFKILTGQLGTAVVIQMLLLEGSRAVHRTEVIHGCFLTLVCLSSHLNIYHVSPRVSHDSPSGALQNDEGLYLDEFWLQRKQCFDKVTSAVSGILPVRIHPYGCWAAELRDGPASVLRSPVQPSVRTSRGAACSSFWHR